MVNSRHKGEMVGKLKSDLLIVSQMVAIGRIKIVKDLSGLVFNLQTA